jgi:hypothetical protein
MEKEASLVMGAKNCAGREKANEQLLFYHLRQGYNKTNWK